ncbi:MAG: hypothetical protein SD837_16400 [Candidatus Electrothrix scaldis]|nr:MAG: hypothetical protein SD837_16400 [Candidatus Electrothrix sp. GW3-3]
MEHSPEEYSKHIDVTELDATLPSTSLHDWLNGLAKASERVAWEFNDCGEQTGSEADRGRDFPKCLEGIIESPSHEKALSIQVYVGTWQRGFVGKPKLGLISYTKPGQSTVEVQDLSSLNALLSTDTVIGNDYPVYYERAREKDYSLIIFTSSKTCIYLNRLTRKDNTTWFYYDDEATWGYYPGDKDQTFHLSLWIKTTKFRFDYVTKGSMLVEVDKAGPQGQYVRVKNNR